MSVPPRLNGLRAFEAAARHMSFKKAAEELCVTHGAVSRHIQNLEDDLGTKLFIRHNRRVELTPAGTKYMQEIGGAFARIYHATSELVADANRKALRVKVPPTFAIRWLVPRLAGYQARNPQISVQISTPYEHPSFEYDVDIAVCYHKPDVPPGIICEPLFTDTLLPVLSPELAKNIPRLDQPNDLANCVLLHSMTRSNDWRRWLDAAGADQVDPRLGLQFENSGLVYQALEEGLGVAISQFAFVSYDIAAGRLLAPFSTVVHGDSGYFLAYPESRVRNRYATEFRDWIVEEAFRTNRVSHAWLTHPDTAHGELQPADAGPPLTRRQ